MEIFERLNKSITEEHTNGELPLNLVAPLQQVANNPDQFSGQISEVETLLKQVNAFEPYADCGCFAQSYDFKDVLKTLEKLGINPEFYNQ